MMSISADKTEEIRTRLTCDVGGGSLDVRATKSGNSGMTIN